MFNDVAGCEEAKVELQEIVGFLKDSWYTKIGASIPRGALLLWTSRTVRPYLLRLSKKPFTLFSISGAEFVEMFVAGASREDDEQLWKILQV